MAENSGQHTNYCSSGSDKEEDNNSHDQTSNKHKAQPTTITKTKPLGGNIFRNDGSFMEMFKKLQQEGQKKRDSGHVDGEECLKYIVSDTSTSSATPASLGSPSAVVVTPKVDDYDEGTMTTSSSGTGREPPKKPPLSFVGKRRGGRMLATGMVKKQRKEPESEKQPEGGKTDAWSQYMSEVRKYKEQSCEEEGKRRPLVK